MGDPVDRKQHTVSHMQKIEWGEADGKTVELYTLTNDRGMTVKVTNYGAILTALHVPDRDGRPADVVLGFDALDGYLDKHPYFGSTVGRVANRIAYGRFTLDGKTYTLATNNGPHHLHGGLRGFDKRVWNVTGTHRARGGATVAMTYVSPDGEEGYPGTVTVSVAYTLTNDQTLIIHMRARTDAPTIVNLANHTYWNLAGHHAGTILNHELTLNAAYYTPPDDTLIPTGDIAPVRSTPFDFTSPKPIGRDFDRLKHGASNLPVGYDHNFVLNDYSGVMRRIAAVTEPSSGRAMEVYTDQPGVQFYTGNFLDGSVTGKDDVAYPQYAGFCLETQKYPDAINKEGRSGWPSVILRPGETYSHQMMVRFM